MLHFSVLVHLGVVNNLLDSVNHLVNGYYQMEMVRLSSLNNKSTRVLDSEFG